MEIDINKLISNLVQFSEDELNAILDARDSDPFESEWLDLNDAVDGSETYPDAEAVFVRISNATHQHEITSYIADDIDLMFNAESKGIETPFLTYLNTCYIDGIVPSKCENIS